MLPHIHVHSELVERLAESADWLRRMHIDVDDEKYNNMPVGIRARMLLAWLKDYAASPPYLLRKLSALSDLPRELPWHDLSKLKPPPELLLMASRRAGGEPCPLS